MERDDGWVGGWMDDHNFLRISGYHLWNTSFIPGTVLGFLSSESIQVFGCRQRMQTLTIISKKELKLSRGSQNQWLKQTTQKWAETEGD